jgi:myosin heavy subunit
MRQVLVPPAPPPKKPKTVESTTKTNGSQKAQAESSETPCEPLAPLHVYVQDDTEAWVPAVVVEKLSKTEVSCRLEETGEIRTVKLKDYVGSELPLQSTFTLPQTNNNVVVVVADLIDLQHVHEAAILYTLRHRHAQSLPYTRCGDLIVSVNPFAWLPHLYTADMQRHYAQELIWQTATTDPRSSLEPHVYEVSSLSYAELAFEGLPQSILITGESGSGKTEATKLLMNHLASVQLGPTTTTTTTTTSIATLRPSKSNSSASSSRSTDIVERILQANPILEAFGNAATVRNDNSSRFGKFIVLQFNRGDVALRQWHYKSAARLVGSHSHVYLLETSRVCWHAPHTERTFHIFYQLLASPTKHTIWGGLADKGPADFRYIGTPIMDSIEGVSDAEQFARVCRALHSIGLNDDTVTALMRAICMVMQLGNVAFVTDPHHTDDRVIVKSQPEFEALSQIMGIEMEELLVPFTVRTMTTRGETFEVRLSTSAANEACDALAKELYLRTFTWLVRAINDKTCAEKNSRHDEARNGPLGTIGMLDIFGFESFTMNGFNQLCINYANERLHQHAMNDIFRDTKTEYDFQGIPLSHVEVDNNEAVLNLIEGRAGLIALLNEECYRPKGNDLAFVSKVLDHLKESKFIVKPKRGVTNQFGVAHYAGVVMYTAHNFVESNQDTLPNDLRECANKCQNPIITEGHVETTREKSAADGDSSEQDTSSCPVIPPSVGVGVAPVSVTTKPFSPKLQNTKEESPFSSFARPRDNGAIDKSGSSPEKVASTKSDFLTNRSKSMPVSAEPPRVRPASSKVIKRQSSSDLMGATVWTKYQDDLSMLMKKLRGTHCRYVRCIKPNPQKQPLVCDRKSTAEQLRCAGIVATVKLSRAIYPNSLPNKLLAVRYISMWDKEKFPSKAKRMDKGEKKHALECESILACALQPLLAEMRRNSGEQAVPKPYAVGKTQTYFRKGVLEWLEAQRVFELDRVASRIQKRARGMIARRHVIRMQSAAGILQTWCRAVLHERAVQRNRAAVVLQKSVRGVHARRHVLQIRQAVASIQNWYRKASHSKALMDAKLHEEATVLQTWYRHVSMKRRQTRTNSAVVIQKWFLLASQKQRQTRTSSAVVIQKWYLLASQKQRQARMTSSIVIQKWYLLVSKEQRQARRQAALVVQAWYRQLTHEHRQKRYCAAQCIQTQWRRIQSRSVWCVQRAAVVRLQQWFRKRAAARAAVIPIAKRKRFMQARSVFERHQTTPSPRLTMDTKAGRS